MQVGPYELLSELGRDGTGVLYRARDPALEREVALKLLLDGERGAGARLETEGRSASRVRHPNVVGVHGTGEHQGRPYLVMDLVEGEPLAARLRRDGALGSGETIRIGVRLARGLAAVHAQGVLHRGVKPENVTLVPGGEPVLVDFSLARLLEGDRLGPASDVLGLGATLFEMLAGSPPLPGAELPPEVDPRLAKLVRRCLARRPARRPDAATLAGHLARLSGEPGPTAPARRLGLAAPLLLIGAVAAALLGLGLGFQLRRARGERAAILRELAEVAGARSEASPSRGALQLQQAAFLHFEAGRHAEARRAIDAALREDPTSVEARLSRAFLADLADDEETLAADAAELVRLRPGEARGWFWLGASEIRRERPTEAIPDLERGLKLAPELSPAWAYLGEAHAMLDQPGRARAAFDRALGLEPGLFDVWALSGQLRLSQGDVEGARADVDQALALVPGHDRALFLRARISFEVDREPARALRELEHAVARGRPEDVHLLVCRAQVHEALGDELAARRDFERALEVCPAWADDLRGQLRARLGSRR